MSQESNRTEYLRSLICHEIVTSDPEKPMKFSAYPYTTATCPYNQCSMPAALTIRHLVSAVALVVIDERIEIVVLNHYYT
jgi:hypothetical protein